MARTGRPSKLTPDVAERIVGAVRIGNFVHVAASLAGIDRVTLDRWLKRGGRMRKGPYREFCNSVNRAIAEAQADAVSCLKKAFEGYDEVKRRLVTKPGKKKDDPPIVVEQIIDSTHVFHPNIALEWLQRRHPNEWSKRQEIDLSTPADKPIEVKVSAIDMNSPRYLAEWMAALADVQIIPAGLIELINQGDGTHALAEEKGNGSAESDG